MSTIKHPVGPQSSSVYWRRRLVVGLGLIAVLVLIFLIIVRPGSSSGEPQPTDAPEAAQQSDESGSGGKAGAAEEAPADGSACNPAQVAVEAITDAVEYPPGQEPQLSVSITNTGSKACTLDVGTAQQVFTVTSGDDVYWDSTHCLKDPVEAQVSLEPGVPVSSATPIPWDRTRSAPDTCDVPTREAAPSGGASYYLTVTVAGIESAQPKQFLLY
jgi:hypothetical protein